VVGKKMEARESERHGGRLEGENLGWKEGEMGPLINPNSRGESNWTSDYREISKKRIVDSSIARA